MGAVTVYLPLAVDTVMKGFTNASYQQRITITPPSPSQPIVFIGSSEGNKQIGSAHFTTPGSWPDPLGYPIDVKLEYSTGAGNWNSSDIFTGSCTIQAYNLTVVVPEDGIDGDWNDSVCMISWPQVG
jgi:hypothetical protein